MASEAFNDSKSLTNEPPSYTTTSTSALADSIQCRKSSIFSSLRRKQKQEQKWKTVLTCICDIVSAPDFTPSSVVPIVNTCAAALTAAEFSSLLQTPNIEGHMALYWAIVNDRREAVAALSGFIAEFSSVCFTDLRLACMSTNDQALFAQLNLGKVNSEEKLLKRSLGWSDAVEVHAGDGLGEHQFVALLRIRKFQRRLHITHDVGVEFVAGGRIWLLQFYMPNDGMWHMGFSLSEPSLPVRANVTIVIEAHKGTPGCAAPPEGMSFQDIRSLPCMLVPASMMNIYEGRGTDKESVSKRNSWRMSDWLMDDETKYVDCDGTLHVRMEIVTLEG
ncbi:hypothetical protein DFH29DRAFT_89764 [Suillus ampliporus]|nr:hypothetical protein DFH29DRAFT_89764 [Suillus ampliporus]